MTHNAILIPMLVLAGWTMCVLLLVPYKRFQAAFAGKVSPRDFELGESARVPPDVSLPNRNYMNLLEMPVLFYMLCLTAFVTGHGDRLALELAWAYVGLRMLHSLIHLIYNNVMHRVTIFAVSNLVLVALWVHLLLAVIR